MKMQRPNANHVRMSACLAVVLVVAACTGNLSQPPLTDLHLRGVRKVADLDRLQGNDQIIYDAMAFFPPGSSDTRVLFRTSQLYSIGLNGQDLRPIRGGKPCYGFLAPTPDGRWVACSDTDGIEIISLVPGASPSSIQLLRAEPLNEMWSPTWSPEGGAIAVINRGRNADCKVALYHVAADRMRASLLASLTFPMFTRSSGKGCNLGAISWSRDAAWLALVSNDAARNPELSIYVLSMANLLLLAGSTTSVPVDVTIAQNDLVRVGESHTLPRIAWSNQGAQQLLTMVEQDLRSIVQVEPLTGVRTPVLTIPVADAADTRNYGYVCSMAWTPDGARLIFVDCAPGNIEVPAVPSKLYVYTPPQSGA